MTLLLAGTALLAPRGLAQPDMGNAENACSRLLDPLSSKARRDQALVTACIRQIPALERAEQLRFATRYARFGYTFIDKSARERFRGKVSSKALLRLGTASIWQEAKDNVDGVRDEVRSLARQAEAQNDTIAIANIRRAQAYPPAHQRRT